jgi:hypothetical protein
VSVKIESTNNPNFEIGVVGEMDEASAASFEQFKRGLESDAFLDLTDQAAEEIHERVLLLEAEDLLSEELLTNNRTQLGLAMQMTALTTAMAKLMYTYLQEHGLPVDKAAMYLASFPTNAGATLRTLVSGEDLRKG